MFQQIKQDNNFKSYVQDDDEALNCSEDAIQADIQPKLLTGEIEVAQAKNVILFYPSINKNNDDNGICGLLVVTNFRISFLSSSYDRNPNDQIQAYQENIFLGKNDIALTNIDRIYQITDKKKKPVGPKCKNSLKIEALQIICKNFRTVKFGFKKSEIRKGFHIANALTQFVFPSHHSLLFSYKYTEKYYNTLRNVTMFNNKTDWANELERCGAKGWRVLSCEQIETGIPGGSLPMYYVVPKNLVDHEYFKYAEHFRDRRAAIWTWSLENAALVRMADLSNINNTTQENAMLEKIRDSHSKKKAPRLLELTRILPSIQDVQHSYLKLRELCTPENARQFMVQDSRFYSQLDKSSWLLYVSLCLKYSYEMSIELRNGISVVLQESDARDMCCVISSLIQLLLDPISRTTNGFQSLIQKEWVILGHRFSDRLGHIINNNTTEQCPLFLLFLDCTWQLLQQFPEDFEFSETYLTTLWDSAFLSIFDTFQFNSEHDRYLARNSEGLILRPVWDWLEQFSEKDIALFTNPLYKRSPEYSRKSLSVLPPNAVPLPGFFNSNINHKKQPNPLPLPRGATSFFNNTKINIKNFKENNHQQNHNERFLEPKHFIMELEIWSQCYYRWLPFLEIENGGLPQIDLFNRMLINNISKLQQALQTGDFDEIPIDTQSTTSNKINSENNYDNNTLIMIPTINSFFPFSRNTINAHDLIDILTQSSDLLTEGSIFDTLSLVQAPD